MARQLNISIYPVLDTNDKTFMFLFNNSRGQTNGWEFVSCTLDYHVNLSSVTSSLVLKCDGALNKLFNSGQPVEITDNGDIVFQGYILSADYQSNEKGSDCIITLAPSIYQFITAQFLFNSAQKDQIKKLTGVDLSTMIITNIVTLFDTDSMIAVMTDNTIFSNNFKQKISYSDLPKQIRVTAHDNETKDIVFRNSLSFFNVVMYQQENGIITIRQLDSEKKCPFKINFCSNDKSNLNKISPSDRNTTVANLEMSYGDNALSMSTITSYTILPANLAKAIGDNTNALTMIANPKYFPRIKELQKIGLWQGLTVEIPLDDSIIKDPAYNAALNKMLVPKNQYLLYSGGSASKNAFYSAYQQLMTAKIMASNLTNYFTYSATISLDDANLPQQLSDLLGSIITVDNSPFNSGMIMSYSRHYGNGSFLNMVIVPIGTITGYWKG